MKHLNPYKIFESNNFNSMNDEELDEKLHWLRTELAEINREISQLVSIKNYRKESSEEELTKDWPDSIWDLDNFQINWVLEHGNDTRKHYDISHKYLYQLKPSVMDIGFNPETYQYFFTICMSYWVDSNNSPNGDDDGIKTIKFLHKNLKKEKIDDQDATRFEVLLSNDIISSYTLFYYDDKIIVKEGRYYKKEYKSIEDAIEELIEKDENTYDQYNL